MFDREAGMPEHGSDQYINVSEEQNYWETVRGVRSYMDWHQVPEFGSSASSLEDNPFPAPRSQATIRLSVKLPFDY